jgi:hypothetical protein
VNVLTFKSSNPVLGETKASDAINRSFSSEKIRHPGSLA